VTAKEGIITNREYRPKCGRRKWMKMKISAALLAIAFALVGPATVLAESPTDGVLGPIIYAPDFVSAIAYGVAMNDAGDMVGTSYTDPGCGPFCLPPLQTVVWKAGVRSVLPSVPGFTGTSVTDINKKGWISGSAGVFGFTDAVVWKPNGNTYSALDLGVLPGTAHSVAIGIDDTNRVVGYATASSGFQTPFMWTEAEAWSISPSRDSQTRSRSESVPAGLSLRMDTGT
jgi:hypothetical protein